MYINVVTLIYGVLLNCDIAKSFFYDSYSGHVSRRLFTLTSFETSQTFRSNFKVVPKVFQWLKSIPLLEILPNRLFEAVMWVYKKNRQNTYYLIPIVQNKMILYRALTYDTTHV